MASGQQPIQGSNGLWNSPDVPSSMSNSSHRGSNNNHSLLSNQFSNSIFNQLLQPSASQRAEAALQQQNFLTLVPNHRSLAAAVQQQLVAASLAAPNVHMMPPVHLQRASQRLLARDLAGQSALLSREEREAILQRFPNSHIGYLSSASQTPVEYTRDQSIERDILAINKAGGSKSGPDAASQLPCQARGMPADHNSSVSKSNQLGRLYRTFPRSLGTNTDSDSLSFCPDRRLPILISQVMPLMASICFVPTQHAARLG